MECFPNGRNAARAPQCVEQNIKSYPTWEVGGQWLTGVQSPEQLARLSNYAPPDSR